MPTTATITAAAAATIASLATLFISANLRMVHLLHVGCDLLPRTLRSPCFRSVSGEQQLLASPGGREARWSSGSWDRSRCGTEEPRSPSAGHKPRALLAGLLLHPNEVVPTDRLIDELWGEDSPEDAAAALRVNVSRLRKALPQDVLTTRTPGYVIRVEPNELDLHRFERLVDEGRSLLARGLATDASERLHDALALWRGQALADFAYESFAQAAIARLEEIRLAAVELRIDVDLALGRPRRACRRARGTRRRAPAPRAPADVSDDCAISVGSAGGGPGCLPGGAPSPRRRARDRSESGAAGAGASDPSAGPLADCRGHGARRHSPGRGAIDPRRHHERDAPGRAARRGRAARARPVPRPHPDQARPGRSRASGPRPSGSRNDARRSKRAVSSRGRPPSQRRRPVRSWLGSPPNSTSISCSPMPPRSFSPRGHRTSSSRLCSRRRHAT